MRFNSTTLKDSFTGKSGPDAPRHDLELNGPMLSALNVEEECVNFDDYFSQCIWKMWHLFANVSLFRYR